MAVTLPSDAVGEVRLTLQIPRADGTAENAQGYAFLRPFLPLGTRYRASNVDAQVAARTRVDFDSQGRIRDPLVGDAWPKVLASDAPGATIDGLQWVLEFHISNVEQQPRDVIFTVPAKGFTNVGLIVDTTPLPQVQVVVSEADRIAAQAAADDAERFRDEAERISGLSEATDNSRVAAFLEFGGPTKAYLEKRLATAGLTPEAVEDILVGITSDDEWIRSAAVQAIQGAAIEEGILTADVIEADEIRISFSDGDVFLRFDLATGRLLSSVALENVKTKSGAPVFTELTADQGWDFTITYANGEIAFGIRADGTIYPDIKPITPAIARVCAFGDSLTAGWASYIAALGTAVGRTAEARGNGGTSSPWIAARQGGQPLRITASNNTIPATGAVSVTLSHAPGVGATTPGVATGNYQGVLGGVAGILAITDVTTGTFTRTTAGRATALPPASPFVTGLDVRDSLPIFWAGRNNFKLARDGEQIIADITRMMAWTKRRDSALILAIPPWAGEEFGTGVRATLDAVNASIRDAFPTAFLDAAAILRSEATLAAVGITATATDLDNIAKGITPESFRVANDAGHLNAKAYEALNLIVADWYKARGLTAAQLELA